LTGAWQKPLTKTGKDNFNDTVFKFADIKSKMAIKIKYSLEALKINKQILHNVSKQH